MDKIKVRNILCQLVVEIQGEPYLSTGAKYKIDRADEEISKAIYDLTEELLGNKDLTAVCLREDCWIEHNKVKNRIRNQLRTEQRSKREELLK